MDSQFNFKVPSKKKEEQTGGGTTFNHSFFSKSAFTKPISNRIGGQLPSIKNDADAPTGQGELYFSGAHSSKDHKADSTMSRTTEQKPSLFIGSSTLPNTGIFSTNLKRASPFSINKVSPLAEKSSTYLTERSGSSGAKSFYTQPTIQNKWIASSQDAKGRSASPSKIKTESDDRFRTKSNRQMEEKNNVQGSKFMASFNQPLISGQSNTFNRAKLNPSNNMTREMSEILKALMDLRNRHCPDDYTRYLILDERDKLLYKWRTELDKNSPSTGKKVITGTLNTMCSEKEKYVRVVQKRVSSYECDENGVMDSGKLVKEYARSAADQEKPLPHELREPNILRFTMNYLLTKILDSYWEIEDLAGWYNFLWTRTRAIRKEITQLMMANELAVSLLECCTRFHIICAYLLCSQDLDKFDQKMNTENLGKCLQTLRHLYEDLAKKEIYCNTEAEFRSYDVLLHLQDSNVLRQVLSYRREVRDSPSVRLAIQLASSIQTNNFSKFFRLLKVKASYLQCCICHRFFTHVRQKALVVMNSSYREPPSNIQYLSKVLAFDDENNALNVLGEYGIYANDKNPEEVEFTKEHLNTNAQPRMVTYMWINNKNTCSLSEVVNGGPVMDTGETIKIVDSFDRNHNYNHDPIINNFINEQLKDNKDLSSLHTKNFVEEKSTESFAKSLTTLPSKQVTSFQKDEEQRKREEEEQLERARRIQAEQDRKQQQLLQQQEEESRKILLQEQTNRRNEIIQCVNSWCSKFCEQIHDQTADNQLRNILNEMWQKSHFERQKYLEFINHATDNLINKILDKKMKVIIKSVVESRKKEIADGLAIHRQRLSRLWLKQFWEQWRKHVEVKKRARKRREQAWQSFTPKWDSSHFVLDRYLSSLPCEDEKTTIKQTFLNTQERIAYVEFSRKRILRILRHAFNQWKEYTKGKIQSRKQAEMLIMQSKRSGYLRRPYIGSNITSEAKWNSRDDSPARKSAKLTLEESFAHSIVPYDFELYGYHNSSAVPFLMESSMVTNEDLSTARNSMDQTYTFSKGRDESQLSRLISESDENMDTSKQEAIQLINECRESQLKTEELKQRANILSETLRQHQNFLKGVVNDIIAKRSVK